MSKSKSIEKKEIKIIPFWYLNYMERPDTRLLSSLKDLKLRNSSSILFKEEVIFFSYLGKTKKQKTVSHQAHQRWRRNLWELHYHRKAEKLTWYFSPGQKFKQPFHIFFPHFR